MISQLGYLIDRLGREPVYHFDPPILVGCGDSGPEIVLSGQTLSVRPRGVTPFVLHFPRGGIYHGHRLYRLSETEYQMDWYVTQRESYES
ncbi:hypothetical protein [Paraburkholderia xenovorans]|jgi:hypothetical protein